MPNAIFARLAKKTPNFDVENESREIGLMFDFKIYKAIIPDSGTLFRMALFK